MNPMRNYRIENSERDFIPDSTSHLIGGGVEIDPRPQISSSVNISLVFSKRPLEKNYPIITPEK